VCLGKRINLQTHKLKSFHSEDAHNNQQLTTINKHITQQMIKEFTPLLGYTPMDLLYYLFKVIKTMLIVLKMPNRWLQWLQNIQKPLVGLFLHQVWPKNEEDILLESFPFKLVVSGSPIRTCVCLTGLPQHYWTKNPAPRALRNLERNFELLVQLVPLRAEVLVAWGFIWPRPNTYLGPVCRNACCVEMSCAWPLDRSPCFKC
jgi:hypothetical protein